MSKNVVQLYFIITTLFFGMALISPTVFADEREEGRSKERSPYLNCQDIESHQRKKSAEEGNLRVSPYITQRDMTCLPVATVNAKIDVYKLDYKKAKELMEEELRCLIANLYYAYNPDRDRYLVPIPNRNQFEGVYECNQQSVQTILGQMPRIHGYEFWFDSMFWQKWGCKWIREQLSQGKGIVMALDDEDSSHAVGVISADCRESGDAYLELRDPNDPLKTFRVKVGQDGYLVGNGDGALDYMSGRIEIGSPYIIEQGS